MSEDKRREIGEGDRESARRYNKHTREFVDSESRQGRSPRPEPLDEEVEMDELSEAEQAALDRAKEQDPQVSRDYEKPTRSSKQ
jgi:hypothetical protein